MFVAKDGFLLYYGERTKPNAQHFDTKPKVSVPRERTRTERERGGGRSERAPLSTYLQAAQAPAGSFHE
jgi:hypothetical protein